MKKSPLLVAAVVFTSISVFAADKPNIEANKIAREASESAKNQDWDAAIEGFKKAADMDRKYNGNLAAALVQRATAATKQNRFPDALNDFSEAIKLHATAGAWEGRAFVYGRMGDYPHAIADYSEAIKMNGGEARLYMARAQAHANPNNPQKDYKAIIADCDKVLKMKKGDKAAQDLKAWADRQMKTEAGQAPAPR